MPPPVVPPITLDRYHAQGLLFGAHHGTSWVSRAIQWQTRSDVSHISTIQPDARLVEAREPHGVVCDRSLHDCRERVDVFFLAVSAGNRVAARRFVLRELEARAGYDWVGILRFVSHRRKEAPAERWFCSEFACATARAALRPLFNHQYRRPDQIDPGWFIASPLLQWIGTLNGPAGPGWCPVAADIDPVPPVSQYGSAA